jgi:flagella basal body P-ring formation protein FlgA
MLTLLLIASSVDPRITDAARLALGNDVRVTAASLDSQTLGNAKNVELRMMSDQRCGRVAALASWTHTSGVGERDTRRQILLTLEREKTVVRASRDLPVGTVLTDSDLSEDRTARCDAREDNAMESKADVIGMRAKVKLFRGMAVRSAEVDKAPVVNAKDRVRLVVSTGWLSASAPGESLQAGAVGDRIRVTNLLSQKTCLARVLDHQTAEVLP